ncbi:SDR family oxidoreductase [Dongia sedimenti]|uniref:SDR family oxidoreductase n=1 Tax=Dongia sedimenti TaxID=3064282 RepID=A0ABU0YTS7_9PROT|nr:SDR family oxidoreductase [Rhodospirillaceae bacterium R-7]
MIKGKNALVTGSTSGLGLAVVEGLARAGCNVMVHGLEPASAVAEQVAALTRDHGVEIGYHQADLSTMAGVEGLIAASRKRLGTLDILVNNAVTRHFARVEDYPTEKWDQALAVNLSAAFHAIRLTLPDMRAKKWGRIINMASVYSSFAVANRVDYVTTKTALIGMTRVVALENVDLDITCNAVCPGAIHTPYSEAKIVDLMKAENLGRAAAERKFLEVRQPTGRFIAAEGVADLVVFLCGPNARDITGSTMPIDAGWTAG